MHVQTLNYTNLKKPSCCIVSPCTIMLLASQGTARTELFKDLGVWWTCTDTEIGLISIDQIMHIVNQSYGSFYSDHRYKQQISDLPPIFFFLMGRKLGLFGLPMIKIIVICQEHVSSASITWSEQDFKFTWKLWGMWGYCTNLQRHGLMFLLHL